MVDVACCHDRGSFARAFFITGSQGAEGVGGGARVRGECLEGVGTMATTQRSSEAANANDKSRAWNRARSKGHTPARGRERGQGKTRGGQGWMGGGLRKDGYGARSGGRERYIGESGCERGFSKKSRIGRCYPNFLDRRLACSGTSCVLRSVQGGTKYSTWIDTWENGGGGGESRSLLSPSHSRKGRKKKGKVGSCTVW